jgi:uncharacterized protein YneF (UPF0154 family)
MRFMTASKTYSYEINSFGDIVKALKESGAGKALLESGAFAVAVLLGIAVFFALVFWGLWVVGKRLWRLAKENPETAKTALLVLAIFGGKDSRSGKRGGVGRNRGPRF